MDFTLIIIVLVLVSGLAGLGGYFGWTRGYHKWVFAVIAALIALTALLFYLSSIATGHHLPGLEEALLGVAVVIGPVVGMILGIASAYIRWYGLILGVIYYGCLVFYVTGAV